MMAFRWYEILSYCTLFLQIPYPAVTAFVAPTRQTRFAEHMSFSGIPQINFCALSPLGMQQTADDEESTTGLRVVQKSTKMLRKKRSIFRMRLFAWLASPSVEVASAMAVLLSVVLVAVDTLDNLEPVAEAFIDDSLLILNVIFAFDFFTRWYAAGQFKLLYLTKPLVIIDIVVVLIPLFLDVVLPILTLTNLLDGVEGETITFLYGLQNSAGLKDLLLLRVLRLRRVLTDVTTFRRFAGALGLKSKDFRPYQLELARVILSIFTLLFVASGLIYTAEHAVNPGINNYFEALYFGLTSLTTVGFGDITPVTPQGRLVVCASIIAGIAVIPAQATRLVDAVIALQREQDPLKPTGNLSKRRRVSRSTALGRRNLADGKGPDGIPIDEAPIEWTEQGADNPSMDIYRVCNVCEASFHYKDAGFCWSCGNQLPTIEQAEEHA
jgi:voltage-gated potassium channel